MFRRLMATLFAVAVATQVITLSQYGVFYVGDDPVHYYIEDNEVEMKHGKFDVDIIVTAPTGSKVDQRLNSNRNFTLTRDDYIRWAYDGTSGTVRATDYTLHVKNCRTTDVEQIIRSYLKVR